MKTLVQLTLVLGLIAVSCNSIQAQETFGTIVVLDVSKVFKSNEYFNKQIEGVQAQAQKLKADVEASQQQLRENAQKINETLAANSPDRKAAEAKLEQEMTSLRTYARQSETELMTQEAKIYYDTYLQMQNIVTTAAQANNIAMVLRFDSSEINKDDRGSVVALVNRGIVFQSKSDITDFVIKQMNPERSADSGATQKK